MRSLIDLDTSIEELIGTLLIIVIGLTLLFRIIPEHFEWFVIPIILIAIAIPVYIIVKIVQYVRDEGPRGAAIVAIVFMVLATGYEYQSYRQFRGENNLPHETVAEKHKARQRFLREASAPVEFFNMFKRHRAHVEARKTMTQDQKETDIAKEIVSPIYYFMDKIFYIDKEKYERLANENKNRKDI